MAQDIELNININEEKNGIELKFNSKPDYEILKRLKEMNFRWHNQNKIWYAGFTNERLEFANILKQELSPKPIVEDIEDVKITPEEIEAILVRGSGVSRGKMRIYEQFQKKLTSKENIDFLKNEYGIGGAYPALSNSDIFENHDAKGIALEKKGRGNVDKLLLKWSDVEKRIKTLISQDKYLNDKEKTEYPKYLEEKRLREQRSDIAHKFKDIYYEFNDYMREIGCNDKLLNGYVLGDCVSQFIQGNKTTYTLSKDNYILPLMRNAMNAIIEENTFLTQRCLEMLELLETDLAKELEFGQLGNDKSDFIQKDDDLLKGIERYNKMLEKSCIRIRQSDIKPDLMYNVKTIYMDNTSDRYNVKNEVISGSLFIERIKEGITSVIDFSEYINLDNDRNKSLTSMIENVQGRQNLQLNMYSNIENEFKGGREI